MTHRRLWSIALGIPLLLASPAVVTTTERTTAYTHKDAGSSVKPPDTPVGRQVAWLVSVSNHLPVTKDEAAKHVHLDTLGLKQLNDLLRGTAGHDGLTLRSFRGQNPPRQARAQGAGIVAGKGGQLFQLIVITPP